MTSRGAAVPAWISTWGRVKAEVAVDLPMLMQTTELQTKTDCRIRAGLTIRF